MFRVNGNLDISNHQQVRSYNTAFNSHNQPNVANLMQQNISPNLLTQMQQIGAVGLVEFLSPTTLTVTGHSNLSNLVLLAQGHDITINFSGYDFQTENVYVICRTMIFNGSGNVDLQRGQIQGSIFGIGSPTAYLGLSGNINFAGGAWTNLNIGGSLNETRRAQAQEAAQREAQARAAQEAAQRAAQELAEKQNEFASAKQAADAQKAAFEQVNNSLPALVSAKTAAEQAAAQKFTALNTTITSLNSVKAETLKISALKLVTVAQGHHQDLTYNPQQFVHTSTPLASFAATANPNYTNAQAQGAAIAAQINALNPNRGDVNALRNAKDQAVALGQQIAAHKATLDQSANTLKDAKTKADAKSQEFQSLTNTNQTLIRAAEQSLSQEKEAVKVSILDKMHECDTHDETPLIKACKQGNTIAINYIFSHMTPAQISNIIFDMKDITGKTALHYAISKGMLLEAKTLVEKGASPHIPDDQGKTAYMFALENPGASNLCPIMVNKFGQPELTPDLRAKIFGEAINAQDSASGDSILIKACKDGKIATVKYIVQFGLERLNLDLQDLTGKTAIHILVEKNMIEQAKVLMEKGASPYIADLEGHTAYSIAYLASNSGLCSLMSEKFGPPPADESIGITSEELLSNLYANLHPVRDDDDISTISGFTDLNLAGDVAHLGDLE